MSGQTLAARALSDGAILVGIDELLLVVALGGPQARLVRQLPGRAFRRLANEGPWAAAVGKPLPPLFFEPNMKLWRPMGEGQNDCGLSPSGLS